MIDFLIIGSGFAGAAMTIHLVEAGVDPKKIIVVEKDKNLTKKLYERFNDKILIINDDILNIDEEKLSKNKIIVFGNLPYNISTQILAKWIKLKNLDSICKKFILMFQKEVADRILAKEKSKNYGRLSILCNWRLEIKKHFNVSKNCFFPRPKVNSTVLSFKPKKNNEFKIKNPKFLEVVTRVLFSGRRKMINKNFSKLFEKNLYVAKELDLNLNQRPEEVSSEMFYKIAIKYEKLFG